MIAGSRKANRNVDMIIGFNAKELFVIINVCIYIFGCLLLFRVHGVFQLTQACHEDMTPFRGRDSVARR